MENTEKIINIITDDELENVNGGSMPKEDPGKGYKWYQIQPGDNLSRIGSIYHIGVDKLMAINQDRRGIKDRNHIIAGFWIRVPR